LTERRKYKVKQKKRKKFENENGALG